MNIFLNSKIALSSFLASISILTITNSVSALTWNISGIFDDGGTLSGTFDFDEGTDTYSNPNINTTAGGIFSGSTYTDDISFFGNSSGFSIEDDGLEFLLTVDFLSSISSIPSIISLDTTTTQEEDFFTGDIRLVSSGNVVAVPFEPSANLAIFILLGLMGLNHYRKKLKS